MPVYFNRLKLYFRFILFIFLVHLHLLFGKIGWCRFYVQVKILQRTKLPVEWLICWGSFNKLYHLLPLHQRGHPCSLNSSLRYNPSFHLSCFWIGGFFIVPLWEVASSGHRNFSSILVSVFVMPSLGCHSVIVPDMGSCCINFYSISHWWACFVSGEAVVSGWCASITHSFTNCIYIICCVVCYWGNVFG